MPDKKTKYITIIIGVCVFILSWLCGLIIGTIILCAGTAWIYARTDRFWKYSIITFIGNVIMGIAAGFSFMAELNIFEYEINTELEVLGALIIYPGAAFLTMLIVIAFIIFAVIRFGLQCLSNLITKKFILKRDKPQE